MYAERVNAERTLKRARRIEQDSLSKELIAKALYIPAMEKPLSLIFESMLAEEDGRVIEIAVVQKMYKEQTHVTVGDEMEIIRGFGKLFRGDDRGFTLDELLYIFQGDCGKGAAMAIIPMKCLESMEKANILVIDREQQVLRQNPNLTQTEYSEYLSGVRRDFMTYRSMQRLLKDAPELNRNSWR